jgi:hypothetical protein
MQSDAFRTANALKNAEDAAQRAKTAESNAKLAELFVMLQEMSGDLRSYSVKFDWGVSAFRSDEKCIYLIHRNSQENAIIFQLEGYWAEGGMLGDHYFSTELGQTAALAAQAIAKSLIDKRALPATGSVEERGWYVSFARAKKTRRDIFIGVSFWLIVGLLAVYFLRHVMH